MKDHNTDREFALLINDRLTCPHCMHHDRMVWAEMIPSHRKIHGIVREAEDKSHAVVALDSNEVWEGGTDHHLFCQGCCTESAIPIEISFGDAEDVEFQNACIRGGER